MESAAPGACFLHSAPGKRRRILSEVSPPITKLEDDTSLGLLIRLRSPRSASHHPHRRRSPPRNSGSPPATRKRRRVCSEVKPHPITKLEDDLLEEILIRLPNPRYTCRCKSVCKRWSSLISDRCFNRRLLSYHQSRTQPPPLFLPSYDTQSVIRSFIPVPNDEVGRCFTVLDSNKDLVLCGFADPDRDDRELARTYLVCNPFTKQWIALPLAPKKTVVYVVATARLVCEPRISHNLELGDGLVYVYSPEYRFRVVCVYECVHTSCIKLDVFCSESGEWTKEALALDGAFALFPTNLLSWDGELWCSYFNSRVSVNPLIASLNPLRLDISPIIYVDASAIFANPGWNLSLRQGALHVVTTEPTPACSTVWRLEEDRKSWRKQCEGLLKTSFDNCDDEEDYAVQLHPEKPEIVFLWKDSGVYICDLSRGDIALVSEINSDVPLWRMHQVRVSCWSTQITRYEELRGAYDGSYSCWVQQSINEAITPSIIGCQLVDRVEQIGQSKGQ